VTRSPVLADNITGINVLVEASCVLAMATQTIRSMDMRQKHGYETEAWI